MNFSGNLGNWVQSYFNIQFEFEFVLDLVLACKVGPKVSLLTSTHLAFKQMLNKEKSIRRGYK